MSTAVLTEHTEKSVFSLWNDETLYNSFMHGDCWVLAKYLHDLTGWDIAVISYKNYDNWKHMGVMTPEGQFIDFNAKYENTDDVISYFVNGYTDDALFFTVDVDEWMRLRDLISGDYQFCFDVLDEAYVYDENNEMIPVADIAKDIVSYHLKRQ